ncbi:MAG: malate synthase A [Alphaproteobacteria bacterium]|nr:malate synthase A [Alphaproteobacteria bacterium]
MSQTAAKSGSPLPAGVEIRGAARQGYESLLTADAITFLAELQRKFGTRREELLKRRVEIQAKIDGGWLPDFRPETAKVRESDWKVGSVPADLQDRRVEITGPVDRKMIINALNSGATHFMADFEDSSTPTWDNLIEGQINLRDAIAGDIGFTDPTSGKSYKLNPKIATLLVRPRGWHLPEYHVRVDGKPVSGSLFDFGLYVFHNAKALKAKGSGPYFYLPKLEAYEEARLWNDAFVFAQEKVGVPQGTIKATVLIETIMASFEMDEILYELKDHIVGLNCGRWDYIFSYIKKFRNRPEFVLPDRDQVGMTRHFLRSYSLLLIKTCHRRGAHAMGGMAAQIPIRNDAAANEAALAKVRADKEREATDGHDGTWVAHPGLVPIAKEIFDRVMPGPNQVGKTREDVSTTAKDLVEVPDGTITEKGVRHNLNVGVQYIEAWLRGTGCVPIYNLMEDAATAEISRAQLWQWVKHGAQITGGPRIDAAMVKKLLAEEMAKLEQMVGAEHYAKGKYKEAAEMFGKQVIASQFADFLTLEAYDQVVTAKP